MPPGAKIVGLIAVLASGVCLAAQTRPDGPGGVPPGVEAGLTGQSALDQASRELLRDMASQRGRVEAVDFEAPSSPTAPSSPLSTLSNPHAAGRRPQAAGSSRPSTLAAHPLQGIPLPPRERSSRPGDARGTGRSGGLPSLITVAGSLGVVLGLFLLVAWVMRRAVPGGSVLLPSEVVEVLGRAGLAAKGQVHLLRCGNKLLLVSMTPSGVETLTEITDPDEVNRLAGLCRQAQPGSATAAFRQVLQQFGGDSRGEGRGTRDER